ncbi:poly-gamma-glutamate hydrolase family protein [Tundrisphaera sp. TA3]|uniref:poly-gamma-glutamate hydrolase family protein n=1 Tax=Tundrisphaera sp. TA3 TaxID=3435775 RepID=UPI003EC09E79
MTVVFRWAVACGMASGMVAIGASGQAPPPQSGADPVAAVRDFGASVRDPLEGEAAIARKKEHCSADAPRLASIGRAVGQQVRITRRGGESGLFTVAQAHEGGPEAVVGIGRLGRLRIGPGEGFEATVSPDVTHSHLTDAEAKAQGDFVERLDDDGTNTGLLIMAPHGGEMEVPTDLQAERVAELLGGKRTSVWRCRGYGVRGGKSAFARWHITSTETSEASFPLLAKVSGRKFEHAVSFHGMVNKRILVGGTGPTRLKVEIRDAIRDAIADPSIPVDLALPGETNGGTTPTNIVNRYTQAGGIQIEQAPEARRKYWKQIAEAVANVYRDKL